MGAYFAQTFDTFLMIFSVSGFLDTWKLFPDTFQNFNFDITNNSQHVFFFKHIEHIDWKYVCSSISGLLPPPRGLCASRRGFFFWKKYAPGILEHVSCGFR